MRETTTETSKQRKCDNKQSYNKWATTIETSIKTIQRTRTKNPKEVIKEL